MAEMTLPGPVSQDLHGQLLEPFDCAGEAKEFWQEAPSSHHSGSHRSTSTGLSMESN